MKKNYLKELKFCEVSENPKFQLSFSLGSKKSPSTIQAGDELNKPFYGLLRISELDYAYVFRNMTYFKIYCFYFEKARSEKSYNYNEMQRKMF